MVRRAGRGAERLHLLEEPRQQRLLVEQRLGLLEQVALVGAAAALGHEQELVGVAVDGGDLDLGRQVVAGVLLVVHVERRHLAVAQVATSGTCRTRRGRWPPRRRRPGEARTGPSCAFTIAVPVSWHIGSTPPAAMSAFFSRSRATNRSLSLASGSSRMLRSCWRWPGRRKWAMSRIASR